MTIVVLDTNILVASHRLESPALRSLSSHSTDWDVQVVVPEITVVETVNVMRRNWNILSTKMRGFAPTLKAIGLTAGIEQLAADIAEYSAEYEAQLRARLDELGITIAPVPAIDHLDIARRASEARAPYSDKGKDGYRDTLVWHTVIQTAYDNPDTEIWFVSDNHTDFGPPPGSWTGENVGDRLDCPIRFHRDLRDELDDLGLADRIQYVVSVERLEQHIASRFAPIEGDDLQSRIDQIDESVLMQTLEVAVRRIPLDRRTAALPISTAEAELVTVRPGPDQQWTLEEAALRGDGSWTARLEITIDSDILILTNAGDVTELTKPLALTADVHLSTTGEITALTVTSAEATPDDPMRRTLFHTRIVLSNLIDDQANRERLTASWESFRNLLSDKNFNATTLAIADIKGLDLKSSLASNIDWESLGTLLQVLHSDDDHGDTAGSGSDSDPMAARDESESETDD